MNYFITIPQTPKAVEARIEFYSTQTDLLMQTSAELSLAYEIAKEYSRQDAAYYSDMKYWLNERYGYVLGNALTFIPRSL